MPASVRMRRKFAGEVRGGGRKPLKQKGTGRARQGSTNAAQWVGGGRIHTPHPRSYEQRMPKKMRQAALRSVLSAKAAEAGIVVVDDFDIKEPKTRLMAETLGNLGWHIHRIGVDACQRPELR